MIDESSHPQPALPEGEPDFLKLVEDAEDALDKDTYDQKRRQEFDAPDDMECVVTFGTVYKLEKLLEAISRLGLSARPKVEDAEVARVVANMRGRLGAMSQQPDKECNEAADLLERLAGDLQNWWSAAIVAMKAQEAAEAKLAEIEAELAKADAVISFYHDFDHYEGGRVATADEEKWDEESTRRHAARQQQKKPTSS